MLKTPVLNKFISIDAVLSPFYVLTLKIGYLIYIFFLHFEIAPCLFAPQSLRWRLMRKTHSNLIQPTDSESAILDNVFKVNREIFILQNNALTSNVTHFCRNIKLRKQFANLADYHLAMPYHGIISTEKESLIFTSLLTVKFPPSCD